MNFADRKVISMPVDMKTLASIDLFSELDTEELEKIVPLLHPLHVTEGEILTRRDDSAHTFFIVLSGNFMAAFEQDRAFTLHNRGDIMGWSTVVSPFQYKGTAVALTDGEVLAMSGQEFQDLLQGDSALSNKIIKKINEVVLERIPYIYGQAENQTN